jgi:hypothetical protein
VSAGPLGGPLAIQLDALFQFVSTGVVFQVELPAKLLLVVASRRVKKAAPETMNPKFFFVFILVSMLS